MADENETLDPVTGDVGTVGSTPAAPAPVSPLPDWMLGEKGAYILAKVLEKYHAGDVAEFGRVYDEQHG